MRLTVGLLGCWIGLTVCTPRTWVKVHCGAGPLVWRFRIRRAPRPGEARAYASGEVSQWHVSRPDGTESGGINWFDGTLVHIGLGRD